eukprot:10454948-Ditylum_brightwellii.AAC.1
MDTHHHFVQKGMVYCQYHASYIIYKCNIKIYIDNKGVVTQISNQIGYTFDYPYNTFEPDWGVIAQSAEYLLGLGSKLTIKHVKSHQYDKCDFKELDLLAQLNIRADNLATSYRENHSIPQVDIP